MKPIAIIGMSGRFPGANDLKTFWTHLYDGIESIQFFKQEEINAENTFLQQESHFMPAKGYLEGAIDFAAHFFGIPPKKAKILDPQIRLFLECVWQACEDAGYYPYKIPGRVGVYATSSSGNSY